MSDHVSTALDDFVQRYLAAAKNHPHMSLVEYDQEWPSECYISSGIPDGQVPWQPIKRKETARLTDLQRALDMDIHPAVISYYTAYWSDNLNAKTSKGQLQLLQPWNQQDFERLQQNLVGHILMKRRLKQPETLFIGLTDEDDFILSVDNESGEVVLEQVGLVPKDVLAANLAEFIHSLLPDTAVP